MSHPFFERLVVFSGVIVESIPCDTEVLAHRSLGTMSVEEKRHIYVENTYCTRRPFLDHGDVDLLVGSSEATFKASLAVSKVGHLKLSRSGILRVRDSYRVEINTLSAYIPF
jgi:hypothetical protein